MATFPGLFQPIGVQPRDEYLAEKQARQQELQYGQTRNALAQTQLQANQNALAQQPDIEKRDRLQKGLAVVAQYNDPQTWQAFLQHATRLGATPAQSPQEFAIANGLQWQAPPSYSVDDLGGGVLAVVDKRSGEIKGAPQFPQDKGPGTLYRVGPHGRYVTAEEAIGQPGYEPPKTTGMPDPMKRVRTLTPAEVTAAGLPEGTVAQQDAYGKIDIVNKPAAAALTPKDASTARAKLVQVKTAQAQLNNVLAKFKDIQNSASAGAFGQGMLPTPSGKAFDAAVDALRNTIQGLTRVPGIGSSSDFESRLAVAQLPNRGDYEDVTAQKIQQIQDLINTIQSGYSEMLDTGGTPPRSGATGGWSIEPVK